MPSTVDEYKMFNVTSSEIISDDKVYLRFLIGFEVGVTAIKLFSAEDAMIDWKDIQNVAHIRKRCFISVFLTITVIGILPFQ